MKSAVARILTVLWLIIIVSRAEAINLCELGIVVLAPDEPPSGGRALPISANEPSIALAQRMAADILNRRAQGLRVVSPSHHENDGSPYEYDFRNLENHAVFGIPSDVESIPTTSRVFRHYTASEGVYRIIIQSQSLLNGYLPYVRIVPGMYRELFQDLTGIFLTTPKHKASEVGVTASRVSGIYYVDVEIPPEVPLLQLEPSIFLIPLPARGYPPWMIEIYRRYLAGDSTLNSEYLRVCRDMEASRQPLQEPHHIGVRVVGHGQVGQ